MVNLRNLLPTPVVSRLRRSNSFSKYFTVVRNPRRTRNLTWVGLGSATQRRLPPDCLLRINRSIRACAGVHCGALGQRRVHTRRQAASADFERRHGKRLFVASTIESPGEPNGWLKNFHPVRLPADFGYTKPPSLPPPYARHGPAPFPTKARIQLTRAILQLVLPRTWTLD